MSQSSLGRVLIGGFVATILFGVPGGPAIGGGLAGYFGEGQLKQGAVTGTLVGVVAGVAVVGFYAIVFELVLRPGLDPRVAPIELTGALAFLVLLYGLSLGVGGGLLGSYLKKRRTAGATAQ